MHFNFEKKNFLHKMNLKRNRSDEPTRFPAHLHGRQEPKAFTFFLLSFSSRESWFLTKRLLERAKVACSQFPVLFRLRTTMSGWALELWLVRETRLRMVGFGCSCFFRDRNSVFVVFTTCGKLVYHNGRPTGTI